jgi:hypothetical protein
MDLDGPAIPPPAGEISILDNPPNSNGLALGVQIFTCVLATIFFALRTYGRIIILKKFQAEESMFVMKSQA